MIDPMIAGKCMLKSLYFRPQDEPASFNYPADGLIYLARKVRVNDL